MGGCCTRLFAPNANAILYAVKRGDKEKVTKLAARSPDLVHFADHAGQTPLHVAAEAGDVELVDILLKAGAKPDVGNCLNETPLMRACLAGHNKVVAALITAGSRVEVRRKGDGRCPLHVAAARGDASLVVILVKSGVFVNASDNKGFTALHLACASGCADAVAQLCELGANCEAVNSEAKMPEDYAVGNKAVLDILAEWTG